METNMFKRLTLRAVGTFALLLGLATTINAQSINDLEVEPKAITGNGSIAA